jgi:hypothetical protein
MNAGVTPIAKTEFQYFSPYAKYLLDYKLNEYCIGVIRASREINIPLLRLFEGYSDEQLLAMSMERNRETLDQIARGKFTEMIEKSTKNWESNQLPLIQRDQVVAEDIVMVSFDPAQGISRFAARIYTRPRTICAGDGGHRPFHAAARHQPFQYIHSIGARKDKAYQRGIAETGIGTARSAGDRPDRKF